VTSVAQSHPTLARVRVRLRYACHTLPLTPFTLSPIHPLTLSRQIASRQRVAQILELFSVESKNLSSFAS